MMTQEIVKSQKRQGPKPTTGIGQNSRHPLPAEAPERPRSRLFPGARQAVTAGDGSPLDGRRASRRGLYPGVRPAWLKIAGPASERLNAKGGRVSAAFSAVKDNADHRTGIHAVSKPSSTPQSQTRHLIQSSSAKIETFHPPLALPARLMLVFIFMDQLASHKPCRTLLGFNFVQRTE